MIPQEMTSPQDGQNARPAGCFCVGISRSGEGDAGRTGHRHTSKVHQQRILYTKAKILNLRTAEGPKTHQLGHFVQTFC